jgi:thiol-disulfide isomerase/thioredoxin
VILALALATVGWWRWWQKRTERRDAELRAEEEARQTPQDQLPRAPDRDPYGHLVGTVAPPFELRDLHGATHSLDSLLALGRPVVLMFMALGCGPCAQVRPDWARWRASLRDRLTLVVISDGDDDMVASRWEELGDEYVLLDPEENTLRAYALSSTPTALVVDRNGLIASTPYSGVLGAELIVRRALRLEPGTVEPAEPEAPKMPPVLQFGTGSA